MHHRLVTFALNWWTLVGVAVLLQSAAAAVAFPGQAMNELHDRYKDCLLALQTGLTLPESGSRCRQVDVGVKPKMQAAAGLDDDIEPNAQHESREILDAMSTAAAAEVAPSVEVRLQDDRVVQERLPTIPRSLMRRFADYYDIDQQFDALHDNGPTTGDVYRLLGGFRKKNAGRRSAVRGVLWPNRVNRKRGPAIDPTFLMMGIGRK